MKQLMKFAVVWILTLSAGLVHAANEEAENAATKVATAWLAVVDAGKYGESWDVTSALLQAGITRAGWETGMNTVRKPLGAMVDRNLNAANYVKDVPGAPAGEFVTVVFVTKFQNREDAVETVTPMKQPDGSWKVSGYFVR